MRSIQKLHCTMIKILVKKGSEIITGKNLSKLIHCFRFDKNLSSEHVKLKNVYIYMCVCLCAYKQKSL